MSLKYSTTTADYLVWSDAMNLIRKLAKDGTKKSRFLYPSAVLQDCEFLTFSLCGGNRFSAPRSLP